MKLHSTNLRPQHPCQRPSNLGFTLIEMVVVVAIIAGLAAILIPVVSEELEGSDEANAMWQCQRIATSITQYIEDVRQFPTGASGAQSFHYLIGTGTVPSTNPFASGTQGTLFDFLCDGTSNGGASWKGPYSQSVPPDPWGNAIVINTHGYFDSITENVWILSAGPNGIIDTQPGAYSLASDDIGVFIE